MVWILSGIGIGIVSFLLLCFLISLRSLKTRSRIDMFKKNRMIISMKRGADEELENTEISFRDAQLFTPRIQRHGAIAMIKTEVRMTKDMHLVCFNDPKTDRLSMDKQAEISELTLFDLRRIDLAFESKQKGNIMTLQEAIEIAPRVWWTIQIKTTGESGILAAQRIISLLRLKKIEARTIVSADCPKVSNYIKNFGSRRLMLSESKYEMNKTSSVLKGPLIALYTTGKDHVNFSSKYTRSSMQIRWLTRKGYSVSIEESRMHKLTDAQIRKYIHAGVTCIHTFNPEKVLNIWKEIRRSRAMGG